MSLSISVCIPCIEEHIHLLKRCVNSIYQQTLLPKEVIISISNITDTTIGFVFTHNMVEDLIGSYRDKLKIYVLLTADKKYAGENRNTAVEFSTGDIISFIDADDIMYTNRINIIHTIFLVCGECICVLHHFTENIANQVEPSQLFDVKNIVDYNFSHQIHFGHPSFKREIFLEYKYSNSARHQDLNFIKSIQKYRNKILIYKQQLTCYISNDSTFFNK